MSKTTFREAVLAGLSLVVVLAVVYLAFTGSQDAATMLIRLLAVLSGALIEPAA
jgi:hypothetical protein